MWSNDQSAVFGGGNIENEFIDQKKKRKRARQIVSGPLKRRQTILQFGQRPLAKCEVCGQVSSTKQHICFIPFSGAGRLITRLDSLEIYELKTIDASIRRVVVSELGYEIPQMHGPSFAAVVSRKIVGFCLCRQLQRAFVSSGGIHLNRTAPLSADLGIDAVWVHVYHRRKGVASTLIDIARQEFFFAFHVPINRLAFSQPTCDGLAFAFSYLDHRYTQQTTTMKNISTTTTNQQPPLLLYDNNMDY
uniref:N-acetyltransferase ESCO acetyl-transferase domain-containing protein n=1 Tax=Aureoumbra lagunensis TaxID=44058 RepID=A0A7S3NGU6_9STRA|mmetsp:Transcript_1463/g.2131  ORF Transcript_1463/g.2131 Transcript_1463/m.2131 type:complete len:247 (+) Transcript_1463:37-777(+)